MVLHRVSEQPEETHDLDQHPILKGLKFVCERQVFKPREFWQVTGLTNDQYGRHTMGSMASKSTEGEVSFDDTEWYVDYGAFINYLDYIELKEAQASSQRAMRIAIIAVSVSIFFGLLSLVV